VGTAIFSVIVLVPAELASVRDCQGSGAWADGLLWPRILQERGRTIAERLVL